MAKTQLIPLATVLFRFSRRRHYAFAFWLERVGYTIHNLEDVRHALFVPGGGACSSRHFMLRHEILRNNVSLIVVMKIDPES